MTRDITVTIPEKDYPFFIALIKKLDFVKVKKDKKAAVLPSTKKEFLYGLKEAVHELNQVKAGKIKGIPAKDLLNDL